MHELFVDWTLSGPGANPRLIAPRGGTQLSRCRPAEVEAVSPRGDRHPTGNSAYDSIIPSATVRLFLLLTRMTMQLASDTRSYLANTVRVAS
jgi:hypothetical protein